MKLVSNRRARYDYDLKNTFQVGVVLSGNEVKSIKAASASLRGSFVHVRGGEAWLVNAYVAPYQAADQTNARRARKLLLGKRELQELIQATQNGQHIVPLDFHSTRGLVKATVGLGLARHKTDKRERLKTKTARREQQLRE